jgi:hypothetical protein
VAQAGHARQTLLLNTRVGDLAAVPTTRSVGEGGAPGPRRQGHVDCSRSMTMQRGSSTSLHRAQAGSVYGFPRSTCPSSHTKHHPAPALIGNVPGWDITNVDTCICPWGCWQGGLHVSLQVIPPATTSNLSPVSFLSSLLSLCFITLLLLLDLENSLLFTFPLPLLYGQFPCISRLCSITSFCHQVLYLC